MKFERKEVVKPVESITGAKVGDKVFFSSHHPMNIKEKSWMASNGVQLNKIYEISMIDRDGHTYIVTDEGLEQAFGGDGGNQRIGVYDIIESAPEPVFAPVTITLESQEEINLVTSMFGMMNPDIREAFGIDDIYAIFRQLYEVADNDRKRLANPEIS